ncbi:MAG: polyprenol monophosphomannose synthase [Acidobacteria bacterium]|nr:polyprenol monophosphomannose synthase [Acidobacteriota bacterium]
MTTPPAGPAPAGTVPAAGSPATGARVLVIIPTYNERENLDPLVRQILARPAYRVMVVDDASPDGTGLLADRLAHEFPGRIEVMHRTGRRGLGRSYVEGMRHALATDADLICQMDADFSHDPKYLPDLVAAADRYDLVIGSRYVRGISVVNWPLRRVILSSFANWYVRAITRLDLRDCTAGFRCWRREALARIPLDRIVSDGYAFVVETAYEAARRGCRIGEVPIIFVERREGMSKITPGVLAESVVMPWRLILRRRK